MLFMMTKVMTQLIYPMNLSLVVAIVAGIFLWRKRTRVGGALLAFAIAWLWLWATPVFSDWVRGTLEQKNLPIPIEQMESADAIVVLGGGVSTPSSPRLYAEISAAGDRVLHAARLFRAGKASWIIVSGGRGMVPGKDADSEAEAMRSVLIELGVPEDAVIAEEESRNTRENAISTKRILDSRGFKKILLVTSALHMPRAMKSFQSICPKVVPAPTDFEVETERPLTLLDWLPDVGALEGSTRAFKEIVGSLVGSLFTR
jgi:uncharacterized SAM-binding protein YcdF (DUF218 family)